MGAIRELCQRRNADGLEVRLLWDSAADYCYIEVTDHGCRPIVVVPAADRVLHAFHHPFAYEPVKQGVEVLV